MKLTAKHTIVASFVGYLTQAITINFAPLLFLTFEKEYGISLGKISLLIAVSFFTQLLTDLLGAFFEKYFPLRPMAVAAHVFAILGMTGFAWLPRVLDPYVGLVISVILAAIGGGLVEVLISPIVEACPTDTKQKSAIMSLLHSFYSWGLAGVVLFSTLFFHFIGMEHWPILSCLWAIIPLVGAVAFCFVPIYDLNESAAAYEEKDHPHSLLRSGLFWMIFVIMFCGGAAEMTMSQWASTFAELALGSKALGDLLGPLSFAILMGIARITYSFTAHKIKLHRFMILSASLCIVSYLIAAMSPLPILSLLGCALCGLSVGIIWPGTLSMGAKKLPFGGVRMFTLLALAGDVGCLAGPTMAGWIAEACGDNLRIPFLIAILFPALIILFSLLLRRKKHKSTSSATSPNHSK